MISPLSLRIYVANGNPDVLCIVDRTNWNGKALVFRGTAQKDF
jgi:ABC-type enterochelin transport system substrate-binding protein